jgi:hypothetical protein
MMAPNVLFVASAAAIALTASCSSEAPQGPNREPKRPFAVEVAGVTLVRAEPEVRRECLSLTRRVGYSVPCPRLLPEYATPYWGRPTGSDEFFQEGIETLRRWVWLSVNFVHRPEVDDHLVISAAPKKVGARRLIFTPKPYPGVKLEPEMRTRLRGREARWFYVSAGGSIYLGHTVLVWSEGGRTYGVGFHGQGTDIRKLGLAVARSIYFVS